MWDEVYWTMLRYGFKDKNGDVYQADQAATVDNVRYLGLTSTMLKKFPPMLYDLYYATGFNDLPILDLEVTHIDYDDYYGYHHTYDIDQICFYKEANNPYGHFSFYYQGTKIPGLEPGAGTVAPLGITRIQGIEFHLDNFITISPVAWEMYIPGSGGQYRKGVSLSFNDNISEFMKNEYASCAPFDYEYFPSDQMDLFSAIFDAQLQGVYWDPEGNAGTPSESGGGLGDYRRPDEEIGIPSLPSVSAADTGFIGIYQVTAAEIQDLAADLWTSDFWQTIIKNFQDPFDNIISLSMIPYDGLTGDLTQIIVGNYKSSAAGQKLATTFFEVDCGIINVNEYYGTYADYVLTDIQLYLPFCGIIQINPDDCMDGKIRVVYHFDIFSGAALAYVQTIVHGSWHILYQVEGNIKSELPINARNYMGVYVAIAKGGLGMLQGAMSGNPFAVASAGVDMIANAKPSYSRSGSVGGTSAMLGVLYPYLIFSTPQIQVPDNFRTLKGYISNQKIRIGDIIGYISADVTSNDIENINCTIEEQKMIIDLLSAGIRIMKEDN